MNIFEEQRKYFESKISFLNSRKLYNSICGYFFENFFHLSKAVENKNIKQISVNHFFDEFGTELCEYYPTIVPKFERFLDNQIIWINEIIRSAKKLDSKSVLTEIDLFKGDLHNNNKSTTRIMLDNGKCFYIKPKNLNAESIFYKLLKTYFKDHRVSFPNFSITALENVEIMSDASLKFSTTCNSNDYYYQLGIASSLFWVLSTGDIFDENIIFQSKYSTPAFIDLECLFGGAFYSKSSLHNPITRSHFRFQNSLIRSALLDTELIQKEGQGPLTTSRLFHNNYRSIPAVNDNRRNCRYLKINHSTFSWFLRGFTHGMERLKTIDKNSINDIVQHSQARLLLRNTRNYDTLIKKICLPEYYLSPKLIDQTENNYLALKTDKSILKHEFTCIRNLDIPVFKIKWDKKNIYDINSNTVGRSNLKMSPKDLYEIKYSILKSNNGINEEVNLLKKCFNIKFDKNIFVKTFSSNHKPLSQQTPSKIENFLSNTLLTSENEILFLEYLSTYDFKNYHVALTDSSIYRGTTGVAIALLDLIKYRKDTSGLSNIEQGIYLQNLKKSKYILNKSMNVDEYSFFSLPTANIFHHLLRSIIYNTEIDFDLLSQYLDWCLIKVRKDRYGDILVGFAGVILFLSNNINRFGKMKSKVQEVIRQYLTELQKRYSPKSGRLNYKIFSLHDNSFSHGLSGFVYVFDTLIKNNHHSDLLPEIISSMEKYLLKTYSEKNGNWFHKDKKELCDSGINHGNTGILLALTSMYERDKSLISYSWIKNTVNNIMLYSSQKDISIANGCFGDILVLEMIRKRNCLESEENEKISRFIQGFDNNSFFDQIKRNCRYFPIGLFSGFSGYVHVQNALLGKNSSDLLSFRIND